MLPPQVSHLTLCQSSLRPRAGGIEKGKGNTQGKPNSPVKTSSELTAGKRCLPHISEHSSSQAASIFYLFLLIFIAIVPQEQGLGPISLWMGDSNQITTTTTKLSIWFSWSQDLPLHQPNAEVHSNPILFIYILCHALYSWQLVLMT